MDSKKLELEQRLSALDGFTESEEREYRCILSTIFDDVRVNVFIVKEFLRHYYKNTKVVKCKQSVVSMCDYKEYECINEISPEVKDIIDIAIDSVARKVYKLFVEKLDYFLANGKIKLTKYEDYLNDPDDAVVDDDADTDTDSDDDTDWEKSDEAFEYRYSGYSNFTEHHIYDKSAYPIRVNNSRYKDFNESDNTVIVEKCKLYSDSLEKFKNNFVDEFKNNLLEFKCNRGFQLLFDDIVKKGLLESRSKRFMLKIRDSEKCDETKVFLNKEYKYCGLNFAVPYLTEINRDVIEKRKEIQALI